MSNAMIQGQSFGSDPNSFFWLSNALISQQDFLLSTEGMHLKFLN